MDETPHRIPLEYDEEDAYRPEPAPPPGPPAWQDGRPRIGIHTSIAPEITAALDRAAAMGSTALQIFSASPRMWPAAGGRRIAEETAARFRARRNELRLGPLAIHTNYLINLGSADRVIRVRSIQAFHDELVRATALGAEYLVTHPGSAGADPANTGPAAAIERIAEGLHQAARGIRFSGPFGPLVILLENTAGQGGSVGWRFEQLAAIIERVGDRAGELPMGVCLDTAHLLAAGYDIRSAEGLERTLEEFDRVVGLERLRMLHVNDSKVGLGARVDRHEHIGKGKIGRAAFRRILNHPLLAGRAFIAETPIDRPGDDVKNVRAMWALLGVRVKQSPEARDGFEKPRARKTKSRGREVRRSGKAKKGSRRRKRRK
jgi:deoxyribonuclease-4